MEDPGRDFDRLQLVEDPGLEFDDHCHDFDRLLLVEDPGLELGDGLEGLVEPAVVVRLRHPFQQVDRIDFEGGWRPALVGVYAKKEKEKLINEIIVFLIQWSN